jgi:hypothetical protein
MEWRDLKQLEALLLETQSHGAQIEEIGRSGQQQPLYSVTIGDKNPDVRVVAIAGMHASEVIGPLALVDLIQKLVQQPLPRLQYHFVPLADPDLFLQNTEQLSEPITLAQLLQLPFIRDLEGHFTADDYPECKAMRQWLERLPQIDAFFSLHAAPVAPGLFFYVSGTSSDCIASVAEHIAGACLPWEIPLLEEDPTNLSQASLFPGFLAMPTAAEMNGQDQRERSGTSIEFVTRRFQPSFLGVCEMPLGVSTALHQAALEEIEEFNQALSSNSAVDLPYRELDVSTQITLAQTFIQAAAHYLLNSL